MKKEGRGGRDAGGGGPRKKGATEGKREGETGGMLATFAAGARKRQHSSAFAPNGHYISPLLGPGTALTAPTPGIYLGLCEILSMPADVIDKNKEDPLRRWPLLMPRNL